MLKITQKTFVNDETNEVVAFAECTIVNDKYDYRVMFDEKTKKRANTWFRSLGFRIGKLSPGETVPEKVVEI